MPDLEKVIKGLEICLNPNLNCYHEDVDCPYESQCWLSDSLPTRPLKEDALELLKEQREKVQCKDCKYSVCYYQRFDNQYVCKKNMNKNGMIPDEDLKGHNANWYCGDGERR